MINQKKFIKGLNCMSKQLQIDTLKEQLAAKSIVIKTTTNLYKRPIYNLQKNIKTLMKKYDLTSNEFANLIDISYSYMQNSFIKDTSINPSLELILRISIVFSINIDDLINSEIEL